MARVVTRSMVYMGGGPVGKAAATSAPLLGASVVIVGAANKDRRDHNRSVGLATVDPPAAPPEHVEQILGVPEVDAAVDCVGFAARGHRDGTEQNAAALNQAMDVTRAAGASGIPGLYVTEDPGAQDPAARQARCRCGSGSAEPSR